MDYDSFEIEDQRRRRALWRTAEINWREQGPGWSLELRISGITSEPNDLETVSWAFGDLQGCLAAVAERESERDQ